jgi:glycerophosphoryl diester phosphodiesterase
MYQRYPEVFKNGSKHIRAVSSTTPRCIVSMNGFTGRMMSLQPDLDFDLDTGEKYYAYIARGENSTLIARTNKALADYRKTIDWDNETVYRNLFTDPAAAKKLIPDAYEFQNAIYDCARVSDPFDIPDNMYRYLPFGNVVHFHELNFLSAYLNQCDSKLNGEIRLPRSQELVDTLISQADAVISGKVKKAADLCFGHDWPYLGLVCYLGLEGVSERYTLEEAKDLWLPSWFCPFAANLQMIFYRSKKSDEILVKFLMNERETRLPALQAVQGPYYRWNDVKAWCEKRIPKTEIVAHRGYWEGNAENSIASFRKAQEFGCWGSEFDIHLTADGVPVINHDQVIAGTDIQKSSFEDVRAHRLANGEHVPTLAEYMAQAARSRECMPVLELKPQGTPEKEDELVDKCLQALRPAAPRNVPPEFASFARRQEPTKVVFISFSHHICQELAKKAPDYTVQYLNGDLSPAQLHAEGINGLDYHYSVFYKHPEWVKEAQDLGMSVNVWTVDDPKDIRAMRDLGVDQITTNKPALVREILWER